MLAVFRPESPPASAGGTAVSVAEMTFVSKGQLGDLARPARGVASHPWMQHLFGLGNIRRFVIPAIRKRQQCPLQWGLVFVQRESQQAQRPTAAREQQCASL